MKIIKVCTPVLMVALFTALLASLFAAPFAHATTSVSGDLNKIYLTADHDHLVFVYKVKNGADAQDLLNSALQFARSAGRATGKAYLQHRAGAADDFSAALAARVESIMKSMRIFYAPHVVARADADVEIAEHGRRFKSKLGFAGVTSLGFFISAQVAEQGDAVYTGTAIASTLIAQGLVLMHNVYRDSRFDEFAAQNDARIKAMYNVQLTDAFIESFNRVVPNSYERAMCELRLLAP